MTVHTALLILIPLGVVTEVVACLGLVAMRRPMDRLHYASAATGLGPAFVAAAICAREGVVSAQGLAALLVAVVLGAAGGTLGLAVARIVRLRTVGSLEPTDAERRRA